MVGNPIKYSEQNIRNQAYDEVYGVDTIHTLKYNPATDSMVSVPLFYGAIFNEWTDGKLTYQGKNLNVSATGTDVDWIITKFSYSGSDCTVMLTKMGSWNGRVALFA